MAIGFFGIAVTFALAALGLQVTSPHASSWIGPTLYGLAALFLVLSVLCTKTVRRIDQKLSIDEDIKRTIDQKQGDGSNNQAGAVGAMGDIGTGAVVATGGTITQNFYVVPVSGRPDVILECFGDTATGSLRLYNRGDEEAYNITVTELSGENGVIYWKHPSRLPARTHAAITFVIRNPGEDKNRISSKEFEAANLVALVLHATYGQDISNRQAAQAFAPVKRIVLVKYLDLQTKTYWQTPCEFIYDRASGSLDINPGDATPIPPDSARPPATSLYP